MIFRIDDVNVNTDMDLLNSIVEMLTDRFCPEIWMVVSPMIKSNQDGSVYPNPPFKDNEFKFFLDVDKIGIPQLPKGDYEVMSHGLIHADHSKMSMQAQELSIVTSCNLLKSETFVPPFNRYNKETELICKEHNIRLATNEIGFEKWNNLDFKSFNEEEGLWYLHPWRYKNIEQFKERFIVNAS